MSNFSENLMEDPEDEGLKAVMGSQFQDVSTGSKPAPQKESKCRKVQQHRNVPVDASWVKLNVISPMAKLKVCAKWALLFGGIGTLLFYWYLAGLLDPKAAIPSFVVCALGAGLTVGYHAR